MRIQQVKQSLFGPGKLVRHNFFALLLCSVVLASACGGTAPQQTVAPSTDPAPINDLRSRYQAAYNAGDAASVAALFSDDATSLPDHHAPVDGKAAIQQHLQEIFAEYTPSMTITVTDTEVLGGMAHEHGTYSLTLTPKASGNPITENGKYLVVLKRQADGAWRIHHDIHNAAASH